MGRREIAVGVLLGVLALGGGAMMQIGPELFPHHHKLIFWLGVAAVVVAVIGLIILFIFPGKRPEPKGSRGERGSITAMARGRGRIDLENVYSTADKLAHVEEDGAVTAKHGVHDPTWATRRPFLRFWPFSLSRDNQKLRDDRRDGSGDQGD